MSASEGPLKQTPLNAIHRQVGAKMVPFGGWDMPVQYRGILEEHKAVRSMAGIFDVSHMRWASFGGPAPWLEKNIGLGYVAVGHSAIGAELEVIIRDTPVSARVGQTPFYKRKR